MAITIDKATIKELMNDPENKETVKAFFKEILLEDPIPLINIIKEIIMDADLLREVLEEKRRKTIEAMIEEDFDKYDEVFKALA